MFEVRSLHPESDFILPEAASMLEECLVFSEDDVLRAVRSFPAGAASGPSGLRPSHMREALFCGIGDVESKLLRALTVFCNWCVSGVVSQGSCQHFIRSSFISL